MEHQLPRSRTHALRELAECLAHEDLTFFDIVGPGVGDRRTNAYIKELRERARRAFGRDYSEARICGDSGLRVDYYFPEEATIVEVAFSLRNAASEFERDLLKAILAKENGCNVGRLVFLCKPGGEVRHRAPASQAFIRWLWENHEIRVEIFDITEFDDSTKVG